MTTNLHAIAGPSKFNRSPKVEPASPDSDTPSSADLKEISAVGGKGGMGEDKGEIKVPAFLTKVFRYVQSQ